MILCTVIPVFSVFVFLFSVENNNTEYINTVFVRIIKSICIYGVTIFVLTEILSQYHMITRNNIVIFWITYSLILFLTGIIIGKTKDIDCSKKVLFDNIKNRWRILLGYCIIFAIVVILGIITVPYNYDSMNYHLPRIMFWIQNKSVEHFASHDPRLLASPVWPSFVNLNAFLIDNNDRLLNLQQAFSFIFNSVCIYKIARKIGLSEDISFLSSLFFMSAPIVFSEALTTQVDNVSAMWGLIFVYIVLDLMEYEKIRLNRHICFKLVILGISAGLGYNSKPSIGLGIVVFAVILLITRIKKNDKPIIIIVSVAIVVAVGIALIIPEVLRNIRTFGAISPKEVGAQQLIGTINPRLVLLNFIKNLAFNFPTAYINESGKVAYKIVEIVAKILKVDIDNPAIAEYGTEYLIPSVNDFGHDTAINSTLVLLLIIALICGIVNLIRKRNIFNIYTVGTVVAYFIFLAILRWEPYDSRYQIFYLGLVAPTIAYLFERAFENKKELKLMLKGIGYFMCITGLVGLVLYNSAITADKAFERPKGYFANNGRRYQGWADTANIINENKYDNLGIYILSNYYTYPLWVMCPNVKRVENVVDDIYDSKKYEDVSFLPDAIIWTGEKNGTEFEWHGGRYAIITDNPEYNIYELVRQ